MDANNFVQSLAQNFYSAHLASVKAQPHRDPFVGIKIEECENELDTFEDQDGFLNDWMNQPHEAVSHDASEVCDNISENSSEAPSPSPSGRSSQGRYLCLGDRQRIRELVISQRVPKSDVAKQFNISLNSVKYILSSKCTLNDNTRAKNGMDPSTTRSSLADKKRTALDTFLTNWIKAEKESTIITRAMIEKQAQMYMRDIHHCEFTPGRKWFQNFRKRCGVRIQEMKRDMKRRMMSESTDSYDVKEEVISQSPVTTDLSSSSYSSVEESAFPGLSMCDLFTTQPFGLGSYVGHPVFGFPYVQPLPSIQNLQNMSADPNFYYQQGTLNMLHQNQPLMNIEQFHQN